MTINLVVNVLLVERCANISFSIFRTQSAVNIPPAVTKVLLLSFVIGKGIVARSCEIKDILVHGQRVPCFQACFGFFWGKEITVIGHRLLYLLVLYIMGTSLVISFIVDLFDLEKGGA